MSITYRDAGVDLEVSDLISERLKKQVNTGLFGGFIPVSDLKQYDEPVLISSIDGIGTKVRLAAELNHFEDLGQDIVHHCVNDIAVHGARPLFFLDYLAFNRLAPDVVGRIVNSIVAACRRLDITLAGGETAEMALVYPEGHFDVAGAIVGVAERAEIVDGSSIAAGDVLLGFRSSGLHTNGYSLVQKLFNRSDYDQFVPALGSTLGDALVRPHRSYLGEIQSLLKTGLVHGLAHITGGGIPGNLSRIIPDGLQAVVDLPETPPLFTYIADRGVSRDEMRRVFNLGIGLIAVCDPEIIDHPVAAGPAAPAPAPNDAPVAAGPAAPNLGSPLVIGRIETQNSELKTQNSHPPEVIFRDN